MVQRLWIFNKVRDRGLAKNARHALSALANLLGFFNSTLPSSTPVVFSKLHVARLARHFAWGRPGIVVVANDGFFPANHPFDDFT
jgi:hypothetical protein